mmetsp:Transcript_69550/g.115557  ORF Transcript_69550/g.115557 Transcript_69550/m.115557 type:complete len:89 (-) Transcript_69550:462-728(-)
MGTVNCAEGKLRSCYIRSYRDITLCFSEGKKVLREPSACDNPFDDKKSKGLSILMATTAQASPKLPVSVKTGQLAEFGNCCHLEAFVG